MSESSSKTRLWMSPFVTFIWVTRSFHYKSCFDLYLKVLVSSSKCNRIRPKGASELRFSYNKRDVYLKSLPKISQSKSAFLTLKRKYSWRYYFLIYSVNKYGMFFISFFVFCWIIPSLWLNYFDSSFPSIWLVCVYL